MWGIWSNPEAELKCEQKILLGLIKQQQLKYDYKSHNSNRINVRDLLYFSLHYIYLTDALTSYFTK